MIDWRSGQHNAECGIRNAEWKSARRFRIPHSAFRIDLHLRQPRPHPSPHRDHEERRLGEPRPPQLVGGVRSVSRFGVQQPAKVQVQMGLQESTAGIDLLAENRLRLIEAAPHVRVLSPLTAEQPRHAGLRSPASAQDPDRVEHLQRERVSAVCGRLPRGVRDAVQF